MSTFQERFASAFDGERRRRLDAEEPRLTKTMVWEAAEATSGAFSQWYDGTTGAKLDTCFKIAPLLKVNPHWLFNESARRNDSYGPSEVQLIDLENHPDLCPVKTYNISVQAGIDGYAIDVDEEAGAPIFFRRDWLRKHGYRPEKLSAHRVKERSMEPKLYEGDLVVINHADKEPKDGEVYVVLYEGKPIVKRLIRDEGAWWLKSDNPDKRYERKRCTESVVIVGRVIYKQSEVI
jgi:phage repressor protein C with HTH and peptisase S24 domain